MATATKPVKVRKPQRLSAAGMVAKIRSDVQSFSANLAGVTRDTVRLAPLVAEAYRQYKEEYERATKLDFFRLFATREQAAKWPQTDAEAKASGSTVQALFNSLEYLLRRAGQIEKEQRIETAVAHATHDAKQEVVRQGLKGEDASQYIAEAESRAREEAGGAPAGTGGGGVARVSPEDVAEIVMEGWFADLDDFDNFAQFVGKLLTLKYSERTVATIIDKAKELIADSGGPEAQEEVEAAAPSETMPTRVVPMRARTSAA